MKYHAELHFPTERKPARCDKTFVQDVRAKKGLFVRVGFCFCANSFFSVCGLPFVFGVNYFCFVSFRVFCFTHLVPLSLGKQKKPAAEAEAETASEAAEAAAQAAAETAEAASDAASEATEAET